MSTERLAIAPEMQHTESFVFGDILILNNPASTGAKTLAQDRIAALERAYPGRIDVFNTEAELEVTRRLVLDKLYGAVGKAMDEGRPLPVLFVGGGDGTINLVLQILMSQGSADILRQIPILPLGSGNANDLARMLFKDVSNLVRVLKQGRVVDIPLLESIVIPPGIKQESREKLAIRRYASNYISVGAFAYGAIERNAKWVRDHPTKDYPFGIGRNIQDFFAVRAAVQAPTFAAEREGKRYQLHEILIGNGDQVAKVFKMPAALAKPELYVAMVQERKILGRLALASDIAHLLRGDMPGELLQGSEREFSFTVLDDVPIQYDGETAELHAGSEVLIRHAPQTFRTLTDKPKNTIQ